MALDRWVALVLLGICLIYGYTAWFMMDGALPPIMKRLAVWPSSFPKVLSIAGIILSSVVLLGVEKGEETGGGHRLSSPTRIQIGAGACVIGINGRLCDIIASSGFFAGDVWIFDWRVNDPWGTTLVRNDRGVHDCDVWDLVSCPRGTRHLPTSTAIFYGDLIDA